MADSDAKPLYKQLIADEQQVNRRIDELAATIIEQYHGKQPLFVCLLRGGAPFASRLLFSIARQDPHFHPEVDYMTIKTYGDTRSDHPSELVMDLSPSTAVAGRDVILLDDVLDKGVTAEFARDTLQQKHGAKEVRCAVLVQKTLHRTHYGDAWLFGFEAPADWLTGMGLDDARLAPEGNRWASFIAIATDEE
jgi:hypoxanthine phosphoribosyltransferase